MKTAPRFIQIHTLTQFPVSLLNRDDSGLAKRAPLGDAIRQRVSSQCLKRHYDENLSAAFPGVAKTVRSRQIFEKEIAGPLVAENKFPEKVVREVIEVLMTTVLGESAKAKKVKAEKAEKADEAAKEAAKDEGPDLATNQVVALGRPEIDYLMEITRVVCSKVGPLNGTKTAQAYFKEQGNVMKQNMASLRMNSGLRSALMGRMTTSDALSRDDAALHVAHSLTVHAAAMEADYFSALDDIESESNDRAVSGHLNATELGAGFFYGYVAIDIPLLISNIEGCHQEKWLDADRDLAAKLASEIVRLVATVSPGAKKGSTAPYAYASFVMVEMGREQPRQFVDAFSKAIDPSGGLRNNTYDALAKYISELDLMYGEGDPRAMAVIEPTDALSKVAIRTNIKRLSAWVLESLLAGNVQSILAENVVKAEQVGHGG